ncbi:putative vacuolar protein sorting-associated protein [Lupinus albus]|uniref:Autophagy-related protein 2 n=1 Tax=Lupinus albus TaxID=3870 RepID=A0A6A4Q0C3_LUPAL|nr:putative vacuolar protein sorting-associated protein [Lupinus albus]
MFPWNIAKSAEALFSRWALKRVCKFFLKKKLGQFILGDIDLDQLDVQLSQGTFQLSDLALNVDFINAKFGKAASLTVKEGSIGYLLVKMPWSGQGCEVEVNELELVVSPCTDIISTSGDESSDDIDSSHLKYSSTRTEREIADDALKSTSIDVHEGVKTIAKMVKWLLTSFHVKITNIIVAFDPSLVNGQKTAECHSALVLRISEIECGTSLSEDADSNADVLGISQLTNFVKFHGAVLELLKIDNEDDPLSFPRVSGEGCGEPVLESNKATCSLMTGKQGGFGGNVKLTIPWKNGSLDICKVDADIYVDPIVLRFQPSTIKWLLHSWETFKNLDKDGKGCMDHNLKGSAQLNSTFLCHSSTSVLATNATGEIITGHGCLPAGCSSLTQPEQLTEALLPASHLISDWVPFSTHINIKDDIQELDFGASVDQFFECIDGMRNSQSALGSSGVWNWTHSVFSAITTASNLASGSMHIPTEPQHVETILRVTFAGISVVLSFCDEEPNHFCNPKIDNPLGLQIDYLGAECSGIVLVLQVCPQGMTLNGTVKLVEVANFLNIGIDAKTQSDLVQYLQAKVLDALPSSTSYDDLDSDSLIGPVATDFPFGNKDHILKITLFRTSGVTDCKYIVQSSSSDGCLNGLTSFSLNLPPFIFWVNFSAIYMLTDLLKEVVKSLEVHNKAKEILSETSDKCGSSLTDVKGRSSPCVTSFSTTECLHGDISISSARIILCFPFEKGGDHASFFSYEEFIALDFTPSSPLSKVCTPDGSRTSHASSQKRLPSVAAQSVQLNFCDLDVYLITSTRNSTGRINSYNLQNEKFSARYFLSVAHRKGCFSVVSVVWQGGQVTGPWIAKKARLFANSEQSKGKDGIAGRGYEFASASTVKDQENWKSQTQQEMILSSSFFMHARLSELVIDVNDSQYKSINRLLLQIVNALTHVTSQEGNVEKESSVSQSSVFLESDSFEVLVSRDKSESESIRSSMQSELPGWWHKFKLKVQKLELLSVSNTGGVKAASFFRLTHGEGKLWGLITGAPDHEFLLVTCSNSSVKRGDGGGSNALSSKCASSDIIFLCDPSISHKITSITVSCATIIAVGGRLDWFDAISYFFSFSASNTEDAGGTSIEKREPGLSYRSSFVLSLIDIALSYEPYLKNLVAQSEFLNSESGLSCVKDMGEQYVACLLATSSLTLSNSTSVDSVEGVYQIRVQDLGLLLHLVSELNYLSGTYSVENFQKTGYVKVAQEAFLEAILKTNCTSGLLWELQLSKSHLCVETCHDTTSALIRLADQLQQLFAPDVEESIVHLQNRWDNIQQAQQMNEFIHESKNLSYESMASTSQQSSPKIFSKDVSNIAGLMDEICEDAFQLNRNNTQQSYSFESEFCMPFDGNLIKVGQISMDEPEVLSHELTMTESVPLIGQEGSQTSFLKEGCFPEIIESYCLSDLRPLSELSVGIHSDQLSRHEPRNVEHRDIERGSGGWYGQNSLEVLENHISEESEQTGLIKAEDHHLLPSNDSSSHSETCGRVILKKIDIKWRIYGGSDWLDSGKTGQHYGRDTSVCLELALSGMKFQYDIFPVGGLRVSKMSVSVQDFYLYDRSQDAPWKLVLGYYQSKGHPRESYSKAFKLDLEAVRPDPLTPLEEYRLNVAFLPILLHLHQRQLDFLVSFFGRKNSLNDQFPDMEDSQSLPEKGKDLGSHSIAQEALLPYFQKLDIWPILVRVDYSPSHVDLAALRHGKYVELVNLVPWKGVELNLKHVHAAGIYGWGSVCETTIGEWLEDISQNQIHKILWGLPTVRSLIAVGAGAAKLVSSPIENYKKERRVLKGMQRGTIAFLRSISLEAVGLGVHLAAGAHDILLQAEYILASVPSSTSLPIKDKSMADVRSNQPKDAQQGIQQAYESLSDGLGKSAAVLVQNPLKKYQRGSGAGPALAAAVRAVPAAAIAPASACASAVHYALLGFRNSLDPERKKQSMEKYCPTQPWEED